jgi:anti-anti-sigma regulatory factor
MDIKVSQFQGKVPVTVIQPSGAVDASNYQDLIARARDLHQAGTQHILVDLSQVPYMSSSGLVALHSIALMLRGEQPPDPDSSWGAMRAFDRERERGMQHHTKLLSPQPRVQKVLDMAGFTRFLEVHTDLDTALESFQSEGCTDDMTRGDLYRPLSSA